MASIALRSQARKCKLPCPASDIAARNSSLSRRATAMTLKPAPASRRPIASPMPRLPPVTRTLRIGTRELARGRHVERFDEANYRWHLVRGQRCAAIGQDLVADLLGAIGAACGEDDVGDHDCAGDRAAPRFGARHPDRSVAVNDGLDLFGVNLQAAYSDDAAATADEVIAVAAQLD